MPENVLSHFGIRNPARTVCLNNAGGFSGSTIWKIEADENYCLRRWPQQVDSRKLQWIHRVLRFAHANGCPEVVVPLATQSGETHVQNADGLWELNRWMDGAADYSTNPGPLRLNSAIETLARFHQATAEFHLDYSPSLNLANVFRRLSDFDKAAEDIDRAGNQRDRYLTTTDWHFFNTMGRNIAAATLQELSPLATSVFSVQPVIRDIRDEHLFFEGDRVSGIIDFGAMQIDIVVCDLARMLGSLVKNDAVLLQTAIATYDSIRPMTDPEIRLIPPLIQAGNLVGILNWLHWLVIENRQFESLEAVKSRLARLMAGLRDAA